MNYINKGVVGMLSLLLLLSLVACGLDDRVDMSLGDVSIVSVSIVDGNVLNGGAAGDQNSSEEENSGQQSSVENKYKSILMGNEDFICADLEQQSVNVQNIGLVITDDTNVDVKAVKFAIIDLDGDGGNEVVLWLSVNGISDVGFEVLHSQNDTIYGYTQYYREFMELKIDGTFTFSGGAADYGMGRLIFSDTGYSVDKQVYSQSTFDLSNELVIQYVANGASCSEDEFYNAMSEQDQKADVEWYDLSADNINTLFDNLL